MNRRGKFWRHTGNARLALVVGLAGTVLTYFALERFNSDRVEQDRLERMFDAEGKLRPIAEIAGTIAAAKLITVQMETMTESTAEDELWRGRAKATIKAPVKLSYGVDLSGIDAKSIEFWPGNGWLFLRAPAPRLLAVEPDLERMEEKIEVTGTRTLARAGHTQRQLATKRLDAEARRMILSPDRQLEVEEKSRTQIEQLLKTLLGNRYEIRVSFATQ